ncbi:MAG: hypothetical protein K5859_06535 [Atopobiaceae bacterium]|nr:hypothetical protein [Atopobiaceae bacterium]
MSPHARATAAAAPSTSRSSTWRRAARWTWAAPSTCSTRCRTPDYTDITEEQYRMRKLLQRVMMRGGFEPYSCEWWHFTLADEPYPDRYFSFPVSVASVRA